MWIMYQNPRDIVSAGRFLNGKLVEAVDQSPENLKPLAAWRKGSQPNNGLIFYLLDKCTMILSCFMQTRVK